MEEQQKPMARRGAEKKTQEEKVISRTESADLKGREKEERPGMEDRGHQRDGMRETKPGAVR